jgi:hypothetical protein
MDMKRSKRECHPKFSESPTKKVEIHTNSKNPKYEINITQNLENSTQKKLKSTQTQKIQNMRLISPKI